MGWGLESEMKFGIEYPKHDATAVYLLAKIARELGVDPGAYAPSPSNMRSVTDWDRLMSDMTGEITRLRQRELAAIAGHDEILKRLEEAEAARDEAQAEVREMLEGRREEEERARMRMLESVLAAAIHPKGIQATVLLPKFADLMHGGASEAGFKRALLDDLDALVALGLRGEVVP